MIIDPILFKSKKFNDILIFSPSSSTYNKIESIDHFIVNRYQFILGVEDNRLLQIYPSLKINNYNLPYYPFKSGILHVLYNMDYNRIPKNI